MEGRTPKDAGDLSNAMVLAAILKAGYPVLVPFGDDQRYDLVMDVHGDLKKIQSKTGRVKDGSVRFDVCSSYVHVGRGKKDYHGEVDFFGVYCPETDTVYMVPIGEVGKRQANLRLEPPRNNQRKGIRLASDYVFPKPSTTLDL
jgi:hypothetical protein